MKVFRSLLILELIYFCILIMNLATLILFKYKSQPIFSLDIDEYVTIYTKLLITLLIIIFTFILDKKDNND